MNNNFEARENVSKTHKSSPSLWKIKGRESEVQYHPQSHETLSNIREKKKNPKKNQVEQEEKQQQGKNGKGAILNLLFTDNLFLSHNEQLWKLYFLEIWL